MFKKGSFSVAVVAHYVFPRQDILAGFDVLYFTLVGKFAEVGVLILPEVGNFVETGALYSSRGGQDCRGDVLYYTRGG